MSNVFSKTITESDLSVDGDRISLTDPLVPYSLPDAQGGELLLVEYAGGGQLQAAEIISYSGLDGNDVLITGRGLYGTSVREWPAGAAVVQAIVGSASQSLQRAHVNKALSYTAMDKYLSSEESGVGWQNGVTCYGDTGGRLYRLVDAENVVDPESDTLEYDEGGVSNTWVDVGRESVGWLLSLLRGEYQEGDSNNPDLIEAISAFVGIVSQESGDVTIGGVNYPSIGQRIDVHFAEVKSLLDAAVPFETKTQMDGYTPVVTAPATTAAAKVLNDTAVDEYGKTVNGLYVWDASESTWVVSEYTAKDYSYLESDVNLHGNTLRSVSDLISSVATDEFTQGTAVLYTEAGTAKSQSATNAGYATAVEVGADFNRISFNITLDSPTECRLSIMDSSLEQLLYVDADCVDGWNTAVLPRLVGDTDDVVLYIGIETLNREPMTTTTIYPSEGYAATTSYPVKATLISGEVGIFTTVVSSQYRVAFKCWNSFDLIETQQKNALILDSSVREILSSSMTTAMADTRGGDLTGGYGNYAGTGCGRATAYITPTLPFDTMRLAVRLESESAIRIYLKDDQLLTFESVDTEILPAGDHFIVAGFKRLYSSDELGDQFYVAFESIDHVSRVGLPNFEADDSKFTTGSTYPLKYVSIADDPDTWTGGGSSTAYRVYAEFSRLTNIKNSLSKAVAIAEASATTTMAIPSRFYAINGLNNQSIYYSNVIKGQSRDYLFDINANNSGRMLADSWQNRTTSSGDVTVVSKLYSSDRVLLDSVTSTLSSTDASAGTGKNPKALFIGDSITQRGFYTQKLLDLAATDVMSLTLTGSKGTSPNLHESAGGKDTNWFYTDAASPFVFSDVFDFAQYMTTNGFSGLDYVFILLGANDIGGLASDTEAIAVSESAATQMEGMITSIKAYDPSIKVSIMLTLAGGTDQDAYGIVYSDSLTYWRVQANRHEFVTRLISEFDNREAEDIYVLPTNCTINTTTGYDVGDPIHPIDDGQGYQDVANTVWAFMKWIEQ